MNDYFSLSGEDDDINEKLFNEMEDEAVSGGLSDKSLSDERSEQQGGLTDSVSTSDEGIPKFFFWNTMFQGIVTNSVNHFILGHFTFTQR